MRARMLLVVGLLSACGGQTSTDAGTIDSGTPDSGTPDAGSDAGLCFAQPTTHFELINACTSAVAIVRHPVLPLLQADGGVPSLP